MKNDIEKFEVTYRNIDELIPSDYNPRKITRKKLRELKDSLTKFGLQLPIIVNMAENRKNVIIGGHQKVKVWKSMGNKTIPCKEIICPDIEKEKEMNLRLNQNQGDFVYDKVLEMGNFDWLLDIGFKKSDLENVMSDFEKKFNDIDTTEPEYEIVPKFSESYNCVMIFCKTELDYTWLRNALEIKKKRCYKSPTSVGECSVVTVEQFQKLWKK
jgi:ParB-like chromosome segregation protein Spo0J